MWFDSARMYTTIQKVLGCFDKRIVASILFLCGNRKLL